MKQLQNLLNALYLPGLLKSKRFWYSIFGMVSVVVAYYQPGFEPYMPQAIQATTFAVVAYVTGQSIKDSVEIFVKAWKEYKPDA